MHVYVHDARLLQLFIGLALTYYLIFVSDAEFGE
jgi:hypothetical protein